jgi:hypothetical protein
MARKYLFVCDGCGATVRAESERLPLGWAVVTSQYTCMGILRVASLDVCSLSCVGHVLKAAPQMKEIAPAPALQALPAKE